MAGFGGLAHRPLRTGCAGVIACAFLLCPGAFAQVLAVSPDCGVAGQTVVQIKGSGWAEPQPICEYIFYFDGVEVAPRQPDGLFGPPNSSFTVPAGAAVGDHIVRVELRLLSGECIQCRQVKFRVVNQIANPWANGMRVVNDPDGRPRIYFNFNPANVCDVTPCTEIRLIQLKRPRGRKADTTERGLTHAEQGFCNAANLDSALINGYSVDYIHGERDPYYNGRDAADTGQPGRQGAAPDSATMNDRPSRADGAYPADIQRIILEFEVNAFCAAGDDRGQWLGRCTWRWERQKGAATGTITMTGCTRDQPTGNFLSALGHWNTLHGFRLPTQQPPTRGGEPCQPPCN